MGEEHGDKKKKNSPFCCLDSWFCNWDMQSFQRGQLHSSMPIYRSMVHGSTDCWLPPYHGHCDPLCLHYLCGSRLDWCCRCDGYCGCRRCSRAQNFLTMWYGDIGSIAVALDGHRRTNEKCHSGTVMMLIDRLVL